MSCHVMSCQQRGVTNFAEPRAHMCEDWIVFLRKKSFTLRATRVFEFDFYYTQVQLSICMTLMAGVRLEKRSPPPRRLQPGQHRQSQQRLLTSAGLYLYYEQNIGHWCHVKHLHISYNYISYLSILHNILLHLGMGQKKRNRFKAFSIKRRPPPF